MSINKYLTSALLGTAMTINPMVAEAGGMSQIGSVGQMHTGSPVSVNRNCRSGQVQGIGFHPTSINNNIQVYTPTNVNNNVNVYKPVNINNNLNVQTYTGNSKKIDVNKPVSINKNIDVNKPASINKNVDVNKPVSINKNIDVNKPVSINKYVDVNKPVSINKNIDINKPVSITKNIDNSKNINITNNIDNSKYINASKNININKTIIINKGGQGGGSSQADAQAEAVAIASAVAAATANSSSSSSAVVNFNGSSNSSSSSSAYNNSGGSESSSSAFGYSGAGTVIGGSSYIAESPGAFAGGDLGTINVESAPAPIVAPAPAQCTFQDTTVVKAIHAVCLAADGHEFPASHMVRDTWINSSYEGEIARCIPGSHLKVVVGKVMQSSEGLATGFTSGQVLECGLHEAVRHYKDGALKCAPALPVPDCTERTNLRKYGTGDMFFTYRAKICLETHDEYPATASIEEDRR